MLLVPYSKHLFECFVEINGQLMIFPIHEKSLYVNSYYIRCKSFNKSECFFFWGVFLSQFLQKCSPLRPITVWCTRLLPRVQSCQETKQRSLRWSICSTIEVAPMCVDLKIRLYVFVCDSLAMGGSGCAGLGSSVQLSAAVYPSFPLSSDDTHFHSLPFRLKFLGLREMVLATAKCLST